MSRSDLYLTHPSSLSLSLSTCWGCKSQQWRHCEMWADKKAYKIVPTIRFPIEPHTAWNMGRSSGYCFKIIACGGSSESVDRDDLDASTEVFPSILCHISIFFIENLKFSAFPINRKWWITEQKYLFLVMFRANSIYFANRGFAICAW